MPVFRPCFPTAAATQSPRCFVLRVAERTYAGTKPYDEKLQAEIRRKLQNQIYEREMKREIDTLWKRSQPQIWGEK